MTRALHLSTAFDLLHIFPHIRIKQEAPMVQTNETTPVTCTASQTRQRVEAEIAARQCGPLRGALNAAASVDPFAQSSSGNVAPTTDLGTR